MKTTKTKVETTMREHDVGYGVRAMYCHRMLKQLSDNMIARGASAEEIAIFQSDFCSANELQIPDSFFPNTMGIDEFIEECTIESDKNTTAKDLYIRYSDLCKDNKIMAKQKAVFFFELKTRGLFANSGTVDGITHRNVVKGIEIKAD